MHFHEKLQHNIITLGLIKALAHLTRTIYKSLTEDLDLVSHPFWIPSLTTCTHHLLAGCPSLQMSL